MIKRYLEKSPIVSIHYKSICGFAILHLSELINYYVFFPPAPVITKVKIKMHEDSLINENVYCCKKYLFIQKRSSNKSMFPQNRSKYFLFRVNLKRMNRALFEKETCLINVLLV